MRLPTVVVVAAPVNTTVPPPVRAGVAPRSPSTGVAVTGAPLRTIVTRRKSAPGLVQLSTTWPLPGVTVPQVELLGDRLSMVTVELPVSVPCFALVQVYDVSRPVTAKLAPGTGGIAACDFGWMRTRNCTGVVVTGDDVTATGLFVEHFQKYNVVWAGERGRTIFFQNELPYDPPDQAAWQHDGSLGWAAYKVADRVRTHTLWGGGSYIFTNVDPTIHASRGFEVPVTPGVQLHDVLTVELSAGTIDHVVNDTGDPVTSAAIGVPSFVVAFP